MSVQDEVADTGLMMMGHRFYAPDHGRFLNRDPIGFAGGLNLFEYAGGRPVSYIDPNGLDETSTALNEGVSQPPSDLEQANQFYAQLDGWYGEGQPEASFLQAFFVGYGDSFSFGATRYVRQWMGTDHFIDEDSSAYNKGHFAALIASIGRLAYAGLARAVPSVARICRTGSLEGTARFAHGARNWLKRIFRFPLPANFGGRLYTWEQMVAKTMARLKLTSLENPADAARLYKYIAESAGRTGRLENLYGPVGIAGNAASRASQP